MPIHVQIPRSHKHVKREVILSIADVKIGRFHMGFWGGLFYSCKLFTVGKYNKDLTLLLISYTEKGDYGIQNAVGGDTHLAVRK